MRKEGQGWWPEEHMGHERGKDTGGKYKGVGNGGGRGIY